MHDCGPSPQAVESAKVIVAGLLKLDPDSITAAITLEPEMFHTDVQREVIRAFLVLQEKGVAAPELADFLAEVDPLVCGPLEVSRLAEAAPSFDPRVRAETLKKDFARRRWMEGMVDLASRVKFLTPDEVHSKFEALYCKTTESDKYSSLTLLSTVEIQSIKWIWKGRIACGKVTIIDGDPGNAKSMLTLDIAARVSSGRAFPDGEALNENMPVILLSAEDGLADTICPRLAAASANTAIIYAMSDRPGQNGPEPITFPRDLSYVEREIKRVRARLVVIDPLMAFLSNDVDSHRDQDVRRVMRGLTTMAERTEAAILIVRHLNKTHSGNPIYRGGGSIGIIGAARLGFAVGKHPTDENSRVLAPTKSNIGLSSDSLIYKVVPCGPSARIEWCGATDLSAEEVLSERQRTRKLVSAESWLVDFIADKEVLANEVLEMGQKAGFSERTLIRAKKKVGIVSIKGSTGWVWKCVEPAQGSQSSV